MSDARIPFNRPTLAGSEFEYMRQAIESGHISGDGAFTKRCHDLLSARHGGARVLLTTSCTAALEMSALLLEVGAGDEVIFPSFTFVSTVNAFVLRGVRPVFVDIRRDTLNLDEGQVEAAITARTRAIVPVHYAGVGCEMATLTSIASEHGLRIVEDNAHGLFGTYRGRALGTFGALSTLSFHETKNITCGEGGALVINDHALVERAEIIREKGTNRSRFFRGEVDKYGWVDVGSSYLPSDLLAAYLAAQLEAADQLQAKRRAVWESYARNLASWASATGSTLPVVPPHTEQPFHMFYILMTSPEARDGLIRHLKQRGIMAVFHYLPLNESPMGRRLAAANAPCPTAAWASERLIRLPFFADLAHGEQSAVIEAVCEFRR